MKGHRTAEKDCSWFRERMVDGRAGMLSDAEQGAWAAHRESCAACAAEVERDEALLSALAALPADAPPPVTWSQVLAARRPTRSPARPSAHPSARAPRPVVRSVWQPALAAAVVLLVAFVVWGLPFIGPRETEVAQAPPPATATVDTRQFTDAHALASAANGIGDPNRAMLMVYAGREDNGG